MAASSKVDFTCGTCSFCGEDFIGFDATSNIETKGFVDNEKSICSVDIIAKATNLVDSNIEKVFASDSLVVAVNLEEEIGDGSEQKPLAVVLQLALEKQQSVSTPIGSSGR
ncbi:hypothetical protein V6N11_043308 [Hibiscus sabdariffa]|uniref:Uncharacterized protein n=1 Tax=Hibiscus sabdariffa TaxID=183260 RepID=A0ABR2QZG8_9ROSI